MYRVICLIDCDSFFASCEQVDNPALQGKAVCVLTSDGGIIISRSKEAKQAGVKMGEPYFKAIVNYPNVIYIKAHHDRYSELSAQVMNIIKSFSPDVEVVSIDEAFVDLTGLDKLYKQSYEDIIKNIRQTINKKLGIPVSIGLSSSKHLAKLASDKAKKSGGIYSIPPHKIDELIGDISIGGVSGIGKQNSSHLKMNGIFTIREFIAKDDSHIRKLLGITGLNLKYELLGNCVSKIDNTPQPPKSIQNTSFLTQFTNDKDILKSSLNFHIHQACRKLRKWSGFCGSCGIMLRTKDFQVLSLREKLPMPTNSEQEISNSIMILFNKIYNPHILYRSSGVSLEEINYAQDYQASLFDTPQYNDNKLSNALDELEQKFGKNIVKTGYF